MNLRLDDYRWLTSEAGKESLRLAETLSLPLLRLTEKLRTEVGDARARLLLDQLALRRRAEAKFSFPRRMFFTEKGLEQATDESIAAVKALRFAPFAKVADLCCGIGGDLLALAKETEVTGIERDPVCVTLASANLLEAGFPREHASVAEADAGVFDVSPYDAWHFDPDRRPGGRKTVRFELHDPGPEVLNRVLGACPNGALKLSPATRWTYSEAAEVELEWISRRRECRQLVVWFGELARAKGCRRATGVSTDGKTVETLLGVPGSCSRIAENLQAFLIEPDPAVLAADLTGEFGKRFDLEAVSRRIPYFTAEKPVENRLAASFEILEAGPFDRKRLVRVLREHRIGPLEIKKSGVDLDPAALRRRLKPSGDEQGTLLVFPHKGGVIAVLARRWQDMQD